ncbi:MAG TPA: hypothetical protein DCQ26_17635 [Marinilabiliales bacterium]|nr:MAG: hypothetical protein A2W84_12570 [Bacteroidetes bacterium GWC2_40_13]OFX72920.1 MAG: hypothetical protein A2W96_04775 [Bacteroidetes bacterium GWD2_40_43]OFX91547.1 MAG: hypothetical protein A2W97_04955 [Bacteroidetes bacterium GWE2_40_63]OFY19708.1 MAG: hypothetical protein A2W88_02845 [Bacteroidetes bacterium GWF2_40_13]HAN00420.1 hypothetical protein [Marinilabiliales bacterium]
MEHSLKKWLRILLYLSILFVIYYLYKLDYLFFSELTINWMFLVASVLFLWSGFLLSVYSWKVSLKVHGVIVLFKDALYSHGISVFGKYLPGKVWVILGRASIISEKGFPLMKLATVSLREQLLYLLLGLLISLVAIPFLPVNGWYSFFVALGALGLGLFLFSGWVHKFILQLLQMFFKKELNIPFIPIRDALPMTLAIMGYWVFWSAGFYFLVLSVLPASSLWVAFAFPASVSCGLLAIFLPGGIGVREGIIVLFLTTLGIDPKIAITISIIQRLWFISGEIFIFGIALIFKKQKSEN